MAWTAPRTWVAGEKATAAIMNLHVRDNLKFLGDDTGWVVPALSNSWVAFGAPYPTPAYRKLGPWVTLKGLMKSGTLGTAIMTLPAGSRPLETRRFVATAGAGFAGLDLSAVGVLSVAYYGAGAGNTAVDIESVKFLAEQ
jgi:hypothetical protein